MSEFRELAFVIDDPYYGRLLPDTDDVLFRYTDTRYDHLRYHAMMTLHTEESGEVPAWMIRCLFIGTHVLDVLAKAGIPETFVDKPSKAVVQAYENDELGRYDKEIGDIIEP